MRRNKDSESVLDIIIRLLEEKSNRYAHFSDHSESPVYRSKWHQYRSAGTPMGVYVYPIKALYRGTATYGLDRKYTYILEATGKVLNLSKMTRSELDRAKLDLEEELGQEQINKIVSRWEKYKHNFPASSLPGAEFWYIIEKANDFRDDEIYSYFSVPGTTVAEYSTSLLRNLGYSTVEDDGEGIIYSSEPIQAFFTSNNSFKSVARIDNEMGITKFY
jgi:hypothetical protein